MKKIIVSACLIGEKVRFDGAHKLQHNSCLHELVQKGHVIPICPEVMGGLSIPRLPSEMRDGKVFDSKGKDVTTFFLKGAEEVLKIAKEHDVKIAILKAKSPSCGVHTVYDGTFSGKEIVGLGIAAELLKKNGVMLFDEFEIEKACELFRI